MGAIGNHNRDGMSDIAKGGSISTDHGAFRDSTFSSNPNVVHGLEC